MDLDAQIAQVSARRQEIWAGAPSEPGEVTRLSKQLEDLYEARRMSLAQNPTVSRADVIRRARVESELERLISR